MKNKLLVATSLSLPVVALADAQGLQQQVTSGLSGLESAVWAVGGIAVSITVAFVSVRLLKRAGRQAG